MTARRSAPPRRSKAGLLRFIEEHRTHDPKLEMLARELAKPRRPYPMSFLSRLLDPKATPGSADSDLAMLRTYAARALYWYDKWLKREGAR
jgi:hypothetical protein